MSDVDTFYHSNNVQYKSNVIQIHEIIVSMIKNGSQMYNDDNVQNKP